MKLLVVVAFLAICGSIAADMTQWDQFKKQFNKRYESVEEELGRRTVFEINLNKIKEHEELRKQGKTTFSMGVTQFADMTTEEYVNTMLSPRLRQKSKSTFVSHSRKVSADPDSVDWRSSNCVRPVSDGATCNLYPLASLIPIEVQECKNTGILTRLSVQNVWDCAGTGCTGFADETYDYILINGGIDTEASYPTTGAPGTCKYNAETVGAKISGYETIPEGDEISLQSAVANIGPVSTVVDASNLSFQLYVSGIYYEPGCDSNTLDLAMTIVGYGSESGNDYWLCQNEWGTSWGEQGYIRMARNKNNNCGIASDASYPTGVTTAA